MTHIEDHVTLGLPDQSIKENEAIDIYSQRVGGHPLWPNKHVPDEKIAQCLVCRQLMACLFQAFIPFDDDLERFVYLFICTQQTCARKAGSVRAWRAVETRRTHGEIMPNTPAKPTVNPFAPSASAHGVPLLFDQTFSTKASANIASKNEDSTKDLQQNLQKLNLDSWGNAPRLEPSWYLYTVIEDNMKPEAENSRVDHQLHPLSKSSPGLADNAWAEEAYEKSQLPGQDKGFSKFLKRLNWHPRQCVRYHYGGEPLAYMYQDQIGKLLFPISEMDDKGQRVTRIGGSKMTAAGQEAKARYDVRKCPLCPQCKAARTFEYQIMPSVISLFRASESVDPVMSEADRLAQLKDIFANKAGTGLDFGTILVFTCTKGCISTDSKDTLGWEEELVYVQYES